MEQKPLWTEQSGRLTLRPFTVYINAAKILKKAFLLKKKKKEQNLNFCDLKIPLRPFPAMRHLLSLCLYRDPHSH